MQSEREVIANEEGVPIVYAQFQGVRNRSNRAGCAVSTVPKLVVLHAPRMGVLTLRNEVGSVEDMVRFCLRFVTKRNVSGLQRLDGFAMRIVHLLRMPKPKLPLAR